MPYWIAACDELASGRRYMLGEWAYHHTYPTSEHRARALNGYLRWHK